MCRLFALRANRPTGAFESLLGSPTSLAHQSVCDRQRKCHDNGWGIGYYVDGTPVRTRSCAAAGSDERYRQLAESVAAPCMLAHVRKASAGSVAERNSHPFLHGRWLFAHNGTLFGFDTAPERLRAKIPAHLKQRIEGETDSEHAFYLFLAHLENPVAPADALRLIRAMTSTIQTLAELYPGTEQERSQLNFVVTDGRFLAASRWGHSLWALERREAGAIVVASEPTTTEAWSEVPDRSLVCVTPELAVERLTLA